MSHEAVEELQSIDSQKRDTWKNKREFLLACLGYAIGIGNVWRFPYLCYRNGGGAFLLPYLFMLFFCGIPLFFMETSLGQFSSTGFITIFKICPLFKGVGYAIVIVNIIVTTYFNTICSYPLMFLYNCLYYELPWINCDHDWNTIYCAKLGDGRNEMHENSTLQKVKTPADEFFHSQILHISDGIEHIGSVVWPLFICNAITWTLAFLCIMKGTKTVGKVVYFTVIFPFVILLVLLIRGLTLPGAWDGVYFYIYPQWDQLTNLKVWADAAVQIFYSLGPGWGGIINMASYNDFRNNNKMDSIVVPIVNCGTSIFAGFVVFSVLGFMSHETGLPVSTVATGGPGLAFVTYPEAISLMPLPHVWAVLFFFMLYTLGLDTLFVNIEAVVNSVVDEFPCLMKHKTWVAFFSVLTMMALSTVFTTNGGMYWIQLFDWYSASISVVFICLIEVLIVGWIYGVKMFTQDVEFMIQEKISWFWIGSWKISNPIILTFIFITILAYNTRLTYQDIEYPDWAIDLGWYSCYASMICIPIYMGYRLIYIENGDLIDRISTAIRTNEDWGPAKKEDKLCWGREVLNKVESDIVPDVTDPYHEQFIQLCSLEC